MVFTMSSVGFPCTSGFVGEFLILVGAYQVSTWLAFGLATGMFLGAAYMLYMYRRVVFGEAVNKDAAKMPDLNKRELGILLPLIILVIWLGVSPTIVTDKISPSVEKLLTHYNEQLEQAEYVTIDDGESIQ